MDIKNPTQFATFISNNGLSGLDPIFNQIVICMNEFIRACDCHKREDKENIYLNCNKLFVQSVKVASRFKTQFLACTSERQILFYTENGNVIAIMSR